MHVVGVLVQFLHGEVQGMHLLFTLSVIWLVGQVATHSFADRNGNLDFGPQEVHSDAELLHVKQVELHLRHCP